MGQWGTPLVSLILAGPGNWNSFFLMRDELYRSIISGDTYEKEGKSTKKLEISARKYQN